MSPEALRQIFSPDADSDLFTLLTLYEPDGVTVLERLSDGFTQRISETDDEEVYGLISRGQTFTFLPMSITLPSEEEANAPRCSIVMQDVTRHLTPIIRTITKPLKVKIELVLSKTPDIVEIVFDDFYISNFTYSAEQVQGELSMISLEREGFPQYGFSPQYNPGLY
jgi:hypothetical protein